MYFYGDRAVMYSRFTDAAIGRVTKQALPRFKQADMELKPIRSKKEYQAAMTEVERLWDAPAKSAEADRLDVLTMLVESHERQHVPFADPDPIEFLGHVMESRDLPRKDTKAFIGPRGRRCAL